ncbi:MAG TPA: c-type cytochrome biogenesis protein CcmI [Burkholderiaceae bacterium]
MTGFPGFLLAAVALLAIGLSFILWPLLRRRGKPTAASAAAIVSVYRDQFHELEAEHRSGAVDAAQFEQNRRELEHRLLEEVAHADTGAAAAPRAIRTAVVLAALVLVVPIVLYLQLGTPEALAPAGEAGAGAGEAQASGQGQAGAKPLTNDQVQKMINGLVAALKQNPNDGDAWAMLARSYAYMRQFPQAVDAYAKAAALKPNDARLFADYADAMAMMNNQRLDGEPMKLIAKALALDPKDVKALALAGTDAFDHKDYHKAATLWERALAAAPNDPEFSKTLQSSIAEAHQLAGDKPTPAPMLAANDAQAAEAPAPAPAGAPNPGGAVVRGQIKLAPALAAKAAPTDTVFVFARAAQGPRMPLALMRRQVKDLPIQFALDDTMAMMPDLTLSKFSPVVIGARVSKSGNAIAASGDLQGFSKPVKVGASGVDVEIDQVVP